MDTLNVIVINEFALPRSECGGNRHIDLFGRLDGWDPLIIAGDRNYYSQKQFQTSDLRFCLGKIPRQGVATQESSDGQPLLRKPSTRRGRDLVETRAYLQGGRGANATWVAEFVAPG